MSGLRSPHLAEQVRGFGGTTSTFHAHHRECAGHEEEAVGRGRGCGAYESSHSHECAYEPLHSHSLTTYLHMCVSSGHGLQGPLLHRHVRETAGQRLRRLPTPTPRLPGRRLRGEHGGGGGGGAARRRRGRLHGARCADARLLLCRVQGDEPVGTLTSQPFLILGSTISFLVGGGWKRYVVLRVLSYTSSHFSTNGRFRPSLMVGGGWSSG